MSKCDVLDLGEVGFDPTEKTRRELLSEQQARGPFDREQLIAKHNSNVYDTAELQAEFEVLGFLAPFVVVKRKADGRKGSLEFQHSPRLYWGFTPD